MTLNREDRWVRAVQVGILMREYRVNFRREDGRTGLTQKQVLDRMAEFSDDRATVHSDSSVGRFERGEILPTRRRLEIFGRALNLSRVEVDGLIVLAGFETASQPMAACAGGPGREPEEREPAGAASAGVRAPEPASGLIEAGGNGIFGEGGLRSFLGEASRFCLFRFLLPGSGIAGSGYLLSTLGISAGWIMMLYVGIAMGLVVFQGLSRLRPATKLRDLLFVSLFFVLSAPLMAVPFVHLDHYGFYLLADPGDSALPILLGLASSLLIALVASLGFDLLWRWQYSGRGGRTAYQRALWAVGPPLGFVYGCLLLFSTAGAWTEFLLVLGVLGGVFATLVVLNDETIKVEKWERKILLWSAVMTIMVVTTIASVAVMISYWEPNAMATQGHTLFHTWEMDYSPWGYSEAELKARIQMGSLWNALSIMAYMVLVMGGTLISAISRLDTTDSGTATADVGETPGGESTRRTTRRERIKSLFGPGGLAGAPVYSRAA